MIIPLRNPHYGSSWIEAHSVYFSLSLSRKRGRWIDNETEIFFSRSNPREKWITRLKYTGNIIVTTAARPRLCSSLCTRLSPSLSSCTVFFFFPYVTTERSISISRLGCVFGFSGEMERQTTFPTTNAKRNARIGRISKCVHAYEIESYPLSRSLESIVFEERFVFGFLRISFVRFSSNRWKI